MHINSNGTSYFIEGDVSKEHYRINKLTNDSYYKWLINKGLAFEFEKRTGIKVYE